MTPRSLRIAYVLPPLVAVVLAFFALTQVNQRGVVGATATVTAIDGGATPSNRATAALLERAAEERGASLVRIIADHRAPESKQELLVTTAPHSRGAEWVSKGYDNFDPGITTTVRPMSDLSRFDPVGDYQVFGDHRAVTEFESAFEDAGYDVETTTLPSTVVIAFEDSLAAKNLLAIAALASAVLCLIGTVGAPRRVMVASIAGRPIPRIWLGDARAALSALSTVALCAPIIALGLEFYNGCAMVNEFVVVCLAFLAAIVAPVATAHALGVVTAALLPVSTTIRGRRPAGFVVWIALLARIPVALLLISGSVAGVGSIARTTDGSTARDLRAAGDTVQLWVSSDRAPGTEAPWEPIGAMARDALRNGDAFLAAPFVVTKVFERNSITALYVDEGYLRRQPHRASDGAIIRASDDAVTVWLPDSLSRQTSHVLDLLSEWELRDVAVPVNTGVLRNDQETYTYPDTNGMTAWTDATVLIVLPLGAEVLSDDDLGALVSSGDVVFRNEGSALRAIHAHHLDPEISAVVSVGQVAADTARVQAVTARVDTITATAALVIAVVTMSLAAVAHRRRFGATVFSRHAAGWAFGRSNRALLGFEAALLIGSVLAALSNWADQALGSTGPQSALDPAALSTPIGALVACGAAVLIAGTSIAVLAVTGRRAIRDHGKET